jgi:hypothetical protein
VQDLAPADYGALIEKLNEVEALKKNGELDF